MSYEIEVKFSVPQAKLRGKRSFSLVSNKKGKALQETANFRARTLVQQAVRCDPKDVVIEHLVIC